MSQCLVVSRNILEKLPFWARLNKVEGKYSAGIKLPSLEITELLSTIEREQKYMERKGDDGVETKPEWQQIIFYALVTQADKFFVYKRNHGPNFGEQRLKDKLSAGVGGHIEPHDANPIDSLPRELDEELEFTLNGTPVAVPQNIEILGVIKDEKDEVGKVHLGLVCVVKVEPNVKIAIKGDENVEGWMTTVEEYETLVTTGNYVPEGWTALLIDNFVKNATN